MGITPGGVHDQAALVGANSLGECLGAVLDKNVSPSLSAGNRCVHQLARVVVDLGNRNLALELGLSNLTLDLAAVDSEISQVCEELLCTVLRADEVEEGGRVVDEGCPALSVDKCRMCEELDQKWNICQNLKSASLSYHGVKEDQP